MGLRVAFIYTLKSSVEQDANDPPDQWAELDSESTVTAICQAIQKAGHEVVEIEGTCSGLQRLFQEKVDIAFNISEGFKGRNREAHIPAILEMMGLPYVGSDVLTLALCLDKCISKTILGHAGIPTAPFALFTDTTQINNTALRFPLFVKPVHEGSSKGISAQSKVHNLDELRRQVSHVCSTYKQGALVEEFLAGREFTVGIIGNDDPYVFAPMEISYEHVPPEANAIYSFQYKKEWMEGHNFICPASIASDEEKRLKEVALAAYRAVGCLDFGRVDLRMDANGHPHVIEINPLPGLAPSYSDYVVAAEANGIGYDELINMILSLAIKRYQLENLESGFISQSWSGAGHVADK